MRPTASTSAPKAVQQADGEPPVASWREAIRPLKRQGLRNLWLAQIVSQLGAGMFIVGIVLAVLNRTNSGTALALTIIAQFLPSLLLGVIAGALVDRWERRRTMIVVDTCRGTIVLTLVLLDGLGVLHPASYAAVAFLLTTGGLFFDPAKSALVPRLVPAADLTATNALLQSTQQIVLIAGPALAGVLVAAAGVNAVFIVCASSFFLSALILSRVPRAYQHRPSQARAGGARAHGDPLRQSIRAGLAFIRHNPLLRLVVGVGSALNLLLSPLPILLPILLKQEFAAASSVFGMAISLIFVGFLLGTALVALLTVHVGIGWLTIIGVVGASIATLLIAFTHAVPVVLLLALVGGAAIGALSVCDDTLIQANTPGEMRGRVLAVYNSVSQGGRALAVATSGVLADTIGIRWVFAGLGVAVGVCALLLARSPTVRDAVTDRTRVAV